MGKRKVTYVGLDFEASGTNPWGTPPHAPIQLGLALLNQGLADTISESASFLLNWHQFEGEYEWQEPAFKVHGITQKTLDEFGMPLHVVDAQAVTWLYNRLGLTSNSRMWTLPVGWNVAGYDRQFITRHFPYLHKMLSYRSVDLGALCSVLAGENRDAYMGYKKGAKQYANNFIDPSRRHDAEVDAVAALHEFEWFRGQIPREMTREGTGHDE